MSVLVSRAAGRKSESMRINLALDIKGYISILEKKEKFHQTHSKQKQNMIMKYKH